MVLPEGSTLPPLGYLVALLAGAALVGLLFARHRQTVGDRHVLALVPWMMTGSAVHVLYVIERLPTPVRPLAGTPAVYVTVAVVAGGVWLAADGVGEPVPRTVGLAGAGALAAALVAWADAGVVNGDPELVWPAAGVVAAAALAAAAWALLRRVDPATATTGMAGPLAVFAHALDGASTAVGVDVLGFGERTPASRLIIEFAAGLPTADLLGAGWLFVVVKLVVATVLVASLADYVHEEPSRGFVLLALVVAVGLGPGVHNVLLFAVA